MARWQYRVMGTFEWASMSGNAILALASKVGSGKRIILRQLDIQPIMQGPQNITRATWVRDGVVGGGQAVVPSACDGQSTWPTTASVVLGASVAGGTVWHRSVVLNNMRPGQPLYWFIRQAGLTGGHAVFQSQNWLSATVEPLRVRPGETLALVPVTTDDNVGQTVMVRVSLLCRVGTATFAGSWFTVAIDGHALLAISVSSGTPVQVLAVGVEEIGDLLTPYLQLVPIAGIDETALRSPYARPPIVKLDTSVPDPWTWIDVAEDVPVLPSGVPQAYFAEGSAGTPKGMSYLHTKDFVGPVWRSAFPELLVDRVPVASARPDDWGMMRGSRWADLGVRRAEITIRPGEGCAVVSAAETATGSTAVGVAGINLVAIGLTFEVAAAATPTLILTGLKNPSEVRVFAANTTTELAGQETVTTGTFSWPYDPDEVSAVDIAVLSLGYQNIRLTNVALGTADVTIPIQQVVDRQYANP